jgi:hypothetical protein
MASGALDETERRLLAGERNLWALMSLSDFSSASWKNRQLLVDVLWDPAVWSDVFAILLASPDRRLHQSLVSFFKSTHSSLDEGVMQRLRLAEAFLLPLSNLSNPSSAFVAGTFLRVISRALDSNAAFLMFEFYQSETIIPTFLSGFPHPVVSQTIIDWTSSGHPELSLLVFYIFKQLFPPRSTFEGQDRVKMCHWMRREFAAATPWDPAARAVAMDVVRLFFEHLKEDAGTFKKFVLAHLNLLPEAAHGSRALYRLAAALGPDEGLCQAALQAIRSAGSLASAGVVACVEYVGVCANDVAPEEALRLLERLLLGEENVPQMAARAAVKLARPRPGNEAFTRAVFAIVRTCWNEKAATNRILGPLCLDILRELKLPGPGAALDVWVRVNGADEMGEVDTPFDFSVKILPIVD